MSRNYPLNTWYVAATSDEVTEQPLGRRLLDLPVVLFRDTAGQVTALADLCPHRGHPLSLGHVTGDRIVCGYHGFEYDTTGACVRVPSQPNPPYDARVSKYLVHESASFVWIWLGDPGVARMHPVPVLPWLDEGWSWTGTNVHVDANYLLVHDHYLDLTHIPYVHRQETPPGLESVPPLDSIQVSESSVIYSRALPPASLADWEAIATGLPRDRTYERRHYGRFISPALLAEGWEIRPDTGEALSQVRIQAVTPETPTTTHLFWRFARDYALDDQTVGGHLHEVFEGVMRTDVDVIEQVATSTEHGKAALSIKVAADAGVLKAHRIIDSLLQQESHAMTTRP